MFRRFEKNDIFHNVVETYPTSRFIIYDRNIYYNNRTEVSGAFTSNVGLVGTGEKNLYEWNVDRTTNQLIKPFIVKGGNLNNFRTIDSGSFRSNFTYGDTITSSYGLSASISSHYYSGGGGIRRELLALRNTLNYYTYLSSHYEFSSSLGNSGSLGNKNTQNLRLISIPSIFYGTRIKKGSVRLRFYVSGSLIGELADNKQNGELRQTTGSITTNNNKVAGVVLYNEGFILLTGSWGLANHTENYGGSNVSASWLWFAETGSSIPSSSYEMSFQGAQRIPTLTMFAHAPEGELNYSNNLTFLDHDTLINKTRLEDEGKLGYYQFDEVPIKNTIKSSFVEPTGSFEKQVFISSIGLYDKDKNLLGIVKNATPTRKRQRDGFSYKIKIDLG